MQNVYILGTGMIKFGRYPAKTVPELGGEAAILALKDAGIDIKDVEKVIKDWWRGVEGWLGDIGDWFGDMGETIADILGDIIKPKAK